MQPKAFNCMHCSTRALSAVIEVFVSEAFSKALQDDTGKALAAFSPKWMTAPFQVIISHHLLKDNFDVWQWFSQITCSFWFVRSFLMWQQPWQHVINMERAHRRRASKRCRSPSKRMHTRETNEDDQTQHSSALHPLCPVYVSTHKNLCLCFARAVKS